MDYAQESLRELLSEYGYTGNRPEILFGIYDFLANESDEALVHGIRAYELSGHDIERVAKLINPDRLVAYIIDVTDETETLANLQEKLFYASDIRSQFSGLGSMGSRYRSRSAQKSNCANSIVELGLEINSRLAEIDPHNAEVLKSYDFKEWSGLYNMRRQALQIAVLAQQHLTEASEETLRILSIYDSLTGTADIRGLDYDVLDAFMRKKLDLGKPSSDGKIHDAFKADAYYEDRRVFGGINREQEWRMRHFGRQRKDWELHQEYRDQSQERREEDQAKLEDDYRRMIEDPWAYYSSQLELLGLTKEMTLAEAKRAFRREVHKYSSAFNTLFNTSPEYTASQEAAKAVLSAWESVSALYKAKEAAEASTTV